MEKEVSGVLNLYQGKPLRTIGKRPLAKKLPDMVAGDEVMIIHRKSPFYQRKGTIVRISKRGLFISVFFQFSGTEAVTASWFTRLQIKKV